LDERRGGVLTQAQKQYLGRVAVYHSADLELAPGAVRDGDFGGNWSARSCFVLLLPEAWHARRSEQEERDRGQSWTDRVYSVTAAKPAAAAAAVNHEYRGEVICWPYGWWVANVPGGTGNRDQHCTRCTAPIPYLLKHECELCGHFFCGVHCEHRLQATSLASALFHETDSESRAAVVPSSLQGEPPLSKKPAARLAGDKAARKQSLIKACQFCYANTASCAARARQVAEGTMAPWDASLDPTTRVKAAQATTTSATVAGVCGAAVVLPAAVMGGPLLSVGIALGGLTTAAAASVMQEVSMEEMAKIAKAVQICTKGFKGRVSLRAFTQGVYYASKDLAGSRGRDGELETQEHVGCPKVGADELQRARHYLHLSNQIYFGEPGMEELAKQGWRLVYHRVNSRHEAPAFALVVREGAPRAGQGDGEPGKGGDDERREAVLIVRGTFSAADALTDLTGVVKEFPRVLGSEGHFAHAGILRAACEVLALVGDALHVLHGQGYPVTITGHSYGAGVAVIMAYLLRDTIQTVRGYGLEPPACVSRGLADLGQEFVTNVVHKDDIIPRFGVHTSEALRARMEKFDWKAQWHASVVQRIPKGIQDAAASVSAGFTAASEGVSKTTASAWSGLGRFHQSLYQALPTGIVGKPVSLLAKQQAWLKDNPQGDPTTTEALPHHDVQAEKEVREEEAEEAKLENEIQKLEAEAGMAEPISPASESVLRRTLETELFLGGRTMHIYGCKGRSRVVWTDRDHPCLRRVETSATMISDHSLVEVDLCLQTALAEPTSPPAWQAWDWGKPCAVCGEGLTTVTGRLRKVQNCVVCGVVTCKDCVGAKRGVPEIGIFTNEPVCTRCNESCSMSEEGAGLGLGRGAAY